LDTILYNVKEGGVDVGASVFTLGYPLAYSGLGTEIKFTDGKISSKTGVNNALNMFQTSVPVQAGNSGSPMFNAKGNLIATVNATYSNTDNVSYAIKLNYLNVLLETVEEPVSLPSSNHIEQLPIEEKVKVLSKYIAIIKVK
jgi:S1-C subfamily serine protease